MQEQYNQSKMGYLEEKLRNSQFEILPHIVIGCPNKGIFLDNVEGASENVLIRSSGPFTIKKEDNP